MLKKVLRRWRWIVAGVALLLVGSLLTGWLLFQHKPAWYQPTQLPPDPAEVQRIRNDLTRTSDELGKSLNQAVKPFRFKLTQDQINAWLAAREAIDPMTREWLPLQLSDPMVVFEKDGIRLAATYTSESLRTIVSAKLMVDAHSKGLTVRLDEVSGGSLSLPRAVVREGLKTIGGRLSAELAEAGVSTPDGHRPRLADLLEGITLPNTGKWEMSGGLRFRVVDVELEPGAITLTIERLRGQEPARRKTDSPVSPAEAMWN